MKKGKNEHDFVHFFLFLFIYMYISNWNKIFYTLSYLVSTTLYAQYQIIRNHFYVNIGVYSI
ncbi:hypothetical protein COD75_00875 [Bacillus anthracis]|nr:hypothetical protein COD75_00875 [Bacillus anthracis]